MAPVVAVLCAVGLGVVGCTAQRDADGGAGLKAAAAQQPPAPSPALALPLDAYGMSPSEQERSDRAQAATERACLKRFGLDWEGPGEEVLREGARLIAGASAERLGLIDEEQARTRGYHPPAWSVRGGRGQEQAGHSGQHEPRDAAKDVLFGLKPQYQGKPVPAQGCRAEAARTLDGPGVRADEPQLIAEVTAKAGRAVSADPRTAAAIKKWSDCLARAGHRYATPRAAALDRRWANADEVTEAETTTAVADVRCKRSTGYVRVLIAVTADHQRRLIAEQAADFSRLKRLKEQRAANIARALG
ncbi:hypothetical protein ACFYVL_13165 [Streptomyces sp. NPDC004111]|uniref:hypothetical protein n=1 Tax=Streptomyces sp. NPDC004111 TaxID=3364690 RepID=UPI0036984C04